MLSSMAFESIQLVTFDCYGTLIDWETGMLASLRPLFFRDGRQIPDAQLLERYGEIEAELEAGPYLPYRQVLSQTAQEMGRRLGMEISNESARIFAGSLVQWEPFADTVSGLRTLAKHFRLGIISNIDDDLFSATQKKLQVEFDVIVTAQQVQSYKPSLKNFQEALRRSNLKKEQILHAGQSVYHDIVPTNALGMMNIWVNRPSIRPDAGAAKPAVAQPSFETRSVAELAALVAPSGKNAYGAN